MKSIVFYFNPNSTNFSETMISNNDYDNMYTIPILPAFCVEYFVAQIGALTYYQDKCDIITNNTITCKAEYSTAEFEKKIIIYYHGIRDYSLLFYWVTEQQLRERLGMFYREAENDFDNGAWLSFALMSGAIFEGILYSKILGSSKTFHDMINYAHSNNIIDGKTKDIMHNVRQFRNLVHSNMYSSMYITRADAMDIRSILDKVIKEF